MPHGKSFGCLVPVVWCRKGWVTHEREELLASFPNTKEEKQVARLLSCHNLGINIRVENGARVHWHG